MTLPYRKILLFLLILVVLLFLMNLWMDKETYPHFSLQYREAFDPKVKADVTAKAEAVVGQDCIFATNTSTLPISELAKASARPAQFIGIDHRVVNRESGMERHGS